MDENTLNRYTRQLRLKQFDHTSQSILQDSHIAIIGLGGLGSPAALYLAAAGVGQLTLADFDTVDISNLHRQILYRTSDIGHKKTQRAKAHLTAINPDIQIETLENTQSLNTLKPVVEEADIVLDCTDNFDIRFAINQACVKYKTPLVSGAGIRLEGQVAVFNSQADSPCYHCLYASGFGEAESCSEIGVLGPVVGMIGCIQALEAIKLLTNIGETLSGRLLLLDAVTMQWRELRLKKDPQCPVCNQ